MNTKIKNIVQVIVLAVFLAVFSFWCWFKPTTEHSASERRDLDKFPELSLNTILSADFMGSFEEYTLDQFPLRDGFRTIKALASKYIFLHSDNNDIFVTSDGNVGKMEYPLKEDQIKLAAAKFQTIYNMYMKNSEGKVFLSVIPDKNSFIAEESGHLSMDYDRFFQLMKENTPFAEYIDISDLLSAEDYYLTDTHWKQEMITDVADRLADKMGVELDNNYTEVKLDKEFAGVYYGQSALPVKKDTLKYLTNKALEGCIVYNYDNDKGEAVKMDFVYDMEKVSGDDLYEIFLSGSVSLLKIENPNASTDKELVVFRDSFGSSLVPLLVSGYKSITVVDIRYIPSFSLRAFIDFSNKDVLFIYSTLVLNNSAQLK